MRGLQSKCRDPKASHRKRISYRFCTFLAERFRQVCFKTLKKCADTNFTRVSQQKLRNEGALRARCTRPSPFCRATSQTTPLVLQQATPHRLVLPDEPSSDATNARTAARIGHTHALNTHVVNTHALDTRARERGHRAKSYLSFPRRGSARELSEKKKNPGGALSCQMRRLYRRGLAVDSEEEEDEELFVVAFVDVNAGRDAVDFARARSRSVILVHPRSGSPVTASSTSRIVGDDDATSPSARGRQLGKRFRSTAATVVEDEHVVEPLSFERFCATCASRVALCARSEPVRLRGADTPR